MTITEAYSNFSGDYEGVLNRLVKEERIIKYVRKFRDCSELDTMRNAVANNDYDIVFRETHNLKGVSMNLGFTPLQMACSQLCEMVRHGKPEGDMAPAFSEIEASYKDVMDSIRDI